MTHSVPRGGVEYFEGALSHGAEYLLLGSSEEGGRLQVLDDARTFAEAKEKAALFLEDHPQGGVLILRHLVAAYRLPVFEKTAH